MSTDAVPEGDRFAWWGGLTEHDVMQTAMTSAHAARFRGRVKSVELSATRVAALAFSPLSARRGPAHIRRQDPEDYFLVLVRGTPIKVEQSRSTACIAAGGMALFDTSHPLAAEFVDQGRQTRLTLLRLPRATLPLPSDRTDRLLGRPLTARSPAGALLGHFLAGLPDSAADADPAELHRMGAIGIDLAATFLAILTGSDDHLPVETRERALLARIDAFIDHNLGDPDLRPGTVAAHHHISVRTLHQLFRQQPETVAATIRRRRLERCRADLADPRLTHRTISETALRWGFRHPADFSRAFRAAYGTAPGDLRHKLPSTPRPVGGTPPALNP
ncbi:helix-turn-helix domain-containing protein [Streptomyces capparidis]